MKVADKMPVFKLTISVYVNKKRLAAYFFIIVDLESFKREKKLIW